MSLVNWNFAINWTLVNHVWASPTQQISGETVGEMKTVLDMHERKAAMAREADAFIALPGNKHEYLS